MGDIAEEGLGIDGISEKTLEKGLDMHKSEHNVLNEMMASEEIQ